MSVHFVFTVIESYYLVRTVSELQANRAEREESKAGKKSSINSRVHKPMPRELFGLPLCANIHGVSDRNGKSTTYEEKGEKNVA